MSAPNSNTSLGGNGISAATVAGVSNLWEETLGDPAVCIAILDGPVDQSHNSLAAASLKWIETLVPSTVDNGPASQHGTHTASIIFARHDDVLGGIAPRCRGLVVPIFKDGRDKGLAPCSQIDLARAILLAAQNGAHVINVSGGQFAPAGTAHPVLVDAVRHCAENGILVVAAAGNDGCDCLHVPAALASVLAVGAMNLQGLPLEFSNWGAHYQASGILAPGENIRGASPGGGTVAMSGTSCATALVAGVAGLLLSLQLKLGRKLDAQSVRAALLLGSVSCQDEPIPDCRRLLAGRLNVEKAMTLVKQGEIHVSEFIAPSELDLAQTAKSSARQESAEPSLGVQPAAFSGTVAVEAPPSAPAPRVVEAAQVSPSACGCGGGGPAQLVFALGVLGFDFGTEARRDSIVQHMEGRAPNPYDPRQLLDYLDKNPWDAASITWTLNLDATAIYAIKPAGPFALETYLRLREFLRDQVTEGVERVSIPGVLAGKATLLNGQVVPVIVPDLRGMYSWTTEELVKSVAGGPPPDNSAHKDKEAFHVKNTRVRDFLERVYFEIRNLGMTPQDRAINFAATNAFNIDKVYEAAIKEDMDLDSIEVERSPICRPESDCWDVKLIFFFPKRQVQTVCKVYRFTVDVSDIVPVSVGPVRSWFVR